MNLVSDEGFGVTTDSSGNIYVTGVSTTDINHSLGLGITHIFLVKYNSSGTKQWTKRLGTKMSGVSETGIDGGKDVTIDSSGNIYVTGYTGGGLDGNYYYGGGVLIGRDIFLVKYNSSGQKQWTRQLGSDRVDVGEGVTTDSSGNIYVTGTTEGILDKSTNSKGRGIFLVKYNSSGTKQWIKEWSIRFWDKGKDVTTDSSGNIYVTGENLSKLDETGSLNIFLIKYNSSGKKLWTKKMGTSTYDSG